MKEKANKYALSKWGRMRQYRIYSRCEEWGYAYREVFHVERRFLFLWWDCAVRTINIADAERFVNSRMEGIDRGRTYYPVDMANRKD